MLKKITLIIFTFLLLPFFCFAYEENLPKGTLVKVISKAPITTENLEEGSIIYLIAVSDVWVLEKKAIEKGDIFKGYVSMLKIPVVGVNAALSVKIDGIWKQNGDKRQISGTLIFNNSDVLGGDLTNPLSYNKSFFPRRVYGNFWGGTYRYVPSGEYEMGHHVTFDGRESLFVQFDEDYYF